MGLLEMVGEIEARAQKATKGPWEYDGYWPDAHWAITAAKAIEILNYSQGETSYPDGLTEEDLRFIADARTSVPRLCAAIRILAEELRFQQDRGNAPAQLALLMAESKLKGETDVHLEFLGDAKTKRRGGVK